MSDCPRIYISKKSLDSKISQILNDFKEYPDDEAVEYIAQLVLTTEIPNLIKFKDFEFISLELNYDTMKIPDGYSSSKFNELVRSYLYTIGVEYQTEY